MRAGKRRLKDKRRGFTLVELLLAMAILLTGLMLAVFPAMFYSARRQVMAANRFTAEFIADTTLDNLMTRAPTNMVSHGDLPVIGADGRCSDTVSGTGGDEPVPGWFNEFTIQSTHFLVGWTVAAHATLPEMNELHVYVWWNAGAQCQIVERVIAFHPNRGDTLTGVP
jgi:prepilin-type N-terminal cleavage/methylation domain-containing protein